MRTIQALLMALVLPMIVVPHAVGQGPSESPPPYLVVIDFKPDPTGTSGKLETASFYELKRVGSDGKPVYEPIDRNRRLVAGRSIAFRVRNINPFKFNAKVENTFTPGANTYSANALGILKGTAATAAPKADRPSGGGGEADADTTKPKVNDVTARVPLRPTEFRTFKYSDESLWRVQPEYVVRTDLAAVKRTNSGRRSTPQASVPVPDDWKVKARNILYQGIPHLDDDEPISELQIADWEPLIQRNADELVDDIGDQLFDEETGALKDDELRAELKKAFQAAAIVLQDDYRTFRIRMIKARKAYALDKIKAEAITAFDGTAHYKELQKTATQVAALGGLGMDMVHISRDAVDIADMRKRAQAALAPIPTIDHLRSALEAEKKSFESQLRLLTTQIEESDKTLGEALGKLEKDVADLESQRKAAEEDRQQAQQDFTNLPRAVVIDKRSQIRAVLRNIDAELQLREIESKIDVLNAKIASKRKGIQDAKTVLASTKKLSDELTKLKEHYDKALPEADKGVTLAVDRYNQIMKATFEVYAGAKEYDLDGKADVKVNLYSIAEDGTEKDLNSPKELVIEVYSPNIMRPVETSVVYAFTGLTKRKFYTDAGNVIRQEPEDDAASKLALFLSLPLRPRSSNSLALDFGYNPTEQDFYAGFSYLWGRSQGATITAGVVLGKVDVLDGQTVRQTLPVGQTIRTRSVSRTALYAGIGFRLKL